MSPELAYFLDKFELYLRRKDDGLTSVTYGHIADCLLDAKLATAKKLEEDRRELSKQPPRTLPCHD
jgi:hypothetical protein